jgi:hypothetical protein
MFWSISSEMTDLFRAVSVLLLELANTILSGVPDAPLVTAMGGTQYSQPPPFGHHVGIC